MTGVRVGRWKRALTDVWWSFQRASSTQARGSVTEGETGCESDAKRSSRKLTRSETGRTTRDPSRKARETVK